MANRTKPLQRIHLVYRRCSPLLKCAILAAIVLSTAALLSLYFTIQSTRHQADSLRLQAAQLEQENMELVRQIAQAGTVQSIKRIATAELGLVEPDAEFFIPVE